MPTVADPHQKPVVRLRRRKHRGLLVFLVVLAALLGAVVYPPTFLFAVRQVLGFEAWRYGFRLSVGSMDGSVTDPIWLYHARLSLSSEAGTATTIEVDKASTSFAWRHVLWQRDAGVWRNLMLDGVRGSIDLPTASGPKTPKAASSPLRRLVSHKVPRLLLPSSLTIHRASVVIRQSEGSVRLDDVDLQASDVEAGHVVIGALALQEPWLTGVFSNCRGALLLQDSKLMLADMKLTDALSIRSASADLPELLRGQLQMKFDLDAFSGKIQGELESGAHEEHLLFDGSGTFANISVAQLAAFFGEDADGSIKEGKFTFRGSPRDLAKATFTTYFEAGDFRWGDRKWNSLVAGATYVDHRLQHLEFQLSQAHNSLVLNGDMSVPEDWKQWWKADFSFVVAAKIDNLSELSALLGPGFGDIFGKLTVDGSVRGDNASFNGQLIVSGSHLSFRKAPLDQLQAAIKLQGNEIQVTNAEFTHGDDFLRANGVVNILGRKRYWGEVKASIADLALYDSFLQPPVTPEAFGGGLMLDWSGDGDASAHSGAFTIKLNRIHPLGSASAETWQPIDLSAEATYSPASIFFSNLVLGNGDTSLSSRVVATPRSLTLENLKLQRGKATWLAGNAQVPLNAWAAWQNPGTAPWWNFDTPCKLDLKFDRLSVHDALLLSGRPQPYDGEVTGNLKSDGTLAKLTANGHLSLKNAGGVFPAGTLKGAGATLDFNGDQLAVTSAAGDWNGLAWTANGAVIGGDVRAPSLDLSVQIPSAPLTLGPGMEATGAVDLKATGRPDALALSGSAQLQSLKIQDEASIASLAAPGGTGLRNPLPSLALPGPPAWKLAVRAGGDAAVTLENTSGKAAPSLDISGSIGKPVVSGRIDVQGFKIAQGLDELAVDEGSYFLNPAAPATNGLALRVTGNAGGDPFDGYILGTFAKKFCTWAPDLAAALASAPDFPAIPAPHLLLNLGAPPLPPNTSLIPPPDSVGAAVKPAAAKP